MPSVGTRRQLWRAVGDAALAALLVFLLWIPAMLHAHGLGLWLCILSAALVLVFLPLRWRHPVLAPAVIVAATVAAVLLDGTQDMGFAGAWALYPLALRHGRWRYRTLWFLLALLFITALGSAPEESTAWLKIQQLAICLIFLAGSWLLGSLVRAHSAAVAAEAVAEAQRASAEDQLALAREVHDVVGHALGVIGMEAGVARLDPTASREQLRETLENVEQSARESLEQVQTLLRSLRGASGAAAYGGSTPGLAELPALVERTRAAGVPVELVLDVDSVFGPHPDAGTGLATYRIVQECLANVVKHSPGASAVVRVERQGDEIAIRVRDDGPGLPVRPGATKGHGLVGIGERARLLGGSADAGNLPDGGFEVRVRLPLSPDTAQRVVTRR